LLPLAFVKAHLAEGLLELDYDFREREEELRCKAAAIFSLFPPKAVVANLVELLTDRKGRDYAEMLPVQFLGNEKAAREESTSDGSNSFLDPFAPRLLNLALEGGLKQWEREKQFAPRILEYLHHTKLLVLNDPVVAAIDDWGSDLR